MRPYLDFCAAINAAVLPGRTSKFVPSQLLEICAQTFLKSYPPSAIRPLLAQLSPQLFSSPENEKSEVFLPPSCFLFALGEFLNPMVEKESNQWLRLIESENPFYLFPINKITHPLKFIKK